MIGKLPRTAVLLALPVALATAPVRAALPPELAAAMQYLREQHSYAWEVINGDPGPVAQSIETARGTIKTVQHNTAPHLKGRLSASGEMLIERDWPDGLTIQTLVAADGAMATNTPDGWLSQQELLEAIAAERLRAGGPSERAQWLPRAEAVDTRRPLDELGAFVDEHKNFEASGDTFIGVFGIQTGNPTAAGEDSQVGQATVTIHLAGGVLRDYEVKSELARYVTRAKIPIVTTSDRIVVLSYLPVGRIDVPDEARAKLWPGRTKPDG